MRRLILVGLVAAGLGLSACSERTQDNAENTVDSAGQDIAKTADRAGNAAEAGANAAGNAAREGAAAVGEAADKAAAETDELGRKAGNAAADVEADLHNESRAEAKRD